MTAARRSRQEAREGTQLPSGRRLVWVATGGAVQSSEARLEMAACQSVTIPIRTVSEANRRDHWAVKAKRAREQRDVTRMVCSTLRRPLTHNLPAIVRLTRIGPRCLDDDNLRGALKHVRDGVADWLGVDDGDEARVLWEYPPQETGKYAVRIEIYECV